MWPYVLNNLLPTAAKLGQGYVFTRVCDSVHRGVCLSACWDTTTPLPREQTPWHQTPRDQIPPGSRHPLGSRPLLGADTPPGSRSPWEQTPPRADPPPSREQCMLEDTGNKRAVRILLECILVFYVGLRKNTSLIF